MKRVLYCLFIIAIALFGVTFSYQNQQTIAINYYFGMQFQVKLLLLLFVTLSLGLLGGGLAMLLNTLRVHRKLFRAKNELRNLQQDYVE